MQHWFALLALGITPLLANAAPTPILLRPDPLNARWLSVPDATKTLMRSGYDYNDANYDSGNILRVEPSNLAFSNAAAAWVLFDVQGPGVLTSMWFTGKNKKGQAYIGGRLNFLFDGESEPAISGELPALFENGETIPQPLAEKSSGGWVCYAPIYFARSLKITVSDHQDSFTHRKNGRGEIIPHIYHQFTYQQLPAPVKSTRRDDLRSLQPWQPDERGERLTREISLGANQSATAFSATGQGILNTWRLRLDGLDPAQLLLRIKADARTNVDLTLPEFFGFNPVARKAARMHSLMLGMDSTNAFYCYWPMPHQSRLTFEIENRGPAGKLVMDTTHLPRWSEPEHFYFYAQRVTDKTEHNRDITLLRASGRGHFAGTILELADKTLEGDERFYVDGEPFPPAWHGTGTEDYFRCGWYFFGGPLTRPLYGLLDAAKPKIAYRFHITDRVNWTRSVAINFEHGHKNEYLGPYNGTVYFYGE